MTDARSLGARQFPQPIDGNFHDSLSIEACPSHVTLELNNGSQPLPFSLLLLAVPLLIANVPSNGRAAGKPAATVVDRRYSQRASEALASFSKPNGFEPHYRFTTGESSLQL